MTLLNSELYVLYALVAKADLGDLEAIQFMITTLFIPRIKEREKETVK